MLHKHLTFNQSFLQIVDKLIGSDNITSNHDIMMISGEVMVRTQIQLSEKQAKLVKSISAEQGISVSEVIRRAIDSMEKFSMDYDAGKKKLALEVVGKFSSGKGDISEKHDEYLSRAFQG